MKVPASATVTMVITSIAPMAAAQSAALPPPAASPAASPAPAPESQPATAPVSPPGWTYTPPPPATPPQEPEFGDPGEYVISSTLFASFGHLGSTQGGASTTSLSIQPSLDYFVGKNVSIGGALYLSYSDSTSGFNMDTTTTALGVYAHVGGNVPVGPSVSWRPLLSIGFRSETSTITAPAIYNNFGSAGSVPLVFPERDEKLLVAQIFAPFLIHPARHFFLGIGPDFFVDLVHFYGSSSSTENRRTFVGVSSIVGGWFGGERD